MMRMLTNAAIKRLVEQLKQFPVLIAGNAGCAVPGQEGVDLGLRFLKGPLLLEKIADTACQDPPGCQQ